jgi:hypothetical protein
MNEITMDEISPFEDGFLKITKTFGRKQNSLNFYSHFFVLTFELKVRFKNKIKNSFTFEQLL